MARKAKRKLRMIFLTFLCLGYAAAALAWSHHAHGQSERPTTSSPGFSRRSFVVSTVTTAATQSAAALVSTPNVAAAAVETSDELTAQSSSEQQRPFRSAAYNLKEYTNSIVASRDTNVSPLEVYETLLQKLKTSSSTAPLRALDVGAGAGVSTQVLWQIGYQNIDAVDWSGDAWQKNVVEEGYCPPSVRFYAMDDERFVEQVWKKREQQQKYDAIAFNFAVNQDKALLFCQTLLKDDGLLLAPINTQKDYWLKQTYQLLNSDGKVVWSAVDVGAWSVQFQPDVTQDTCQGVWCPPYNGFQKMKRQSK